MTTSTWRLTRCLWIPVHKDSQDVYEYKYTRIRKMFMNTSTQGFARCLWLPVHEDSQDVYEYRYTRIRKMFMTTSTWGFTRWLRIPVHKDSQDVYEYEYCRLRVACTKWSHGQTSSERNETGRKNTKYWTGGGGPRAHRAELNRQHAVNYPQNRKDPGTGLWGGG